MPDKKSRGGSPSRPYAFMPILVSPPANQDVWIVLLFSFAFILVINAPLRLLMNKFRGMNINTGDCIGEITG